VRLRSPATHQRSLTLTIKLSALRRDGKTLYRAGHESWRLT
jgi:hypothetical protein